VPAHACDAIRGKGVDATFGEYLFGFVKHDYRMPDPETALPASRATTRAPLFALDEELMRQAKRIPIERHRPSKSWFSTTNRS
jgi:hypothetical protein